MMVFYAPIKAVHITAVLCSGGFFALRGAMVLAGSKWALSAPLRYLSYGIDTILLTAALMLLTVLPAAVFANGWLLVKLTLLVIYIGLGSFALKRGRTPRSRVACYLAAIAVFGFMLSVARTHSPWGVLETWAETWSN